jgi:hypothetical protein
VNLKLVDSDEENDPLFDGQLPVQFDDPRMVSELTFFVPGLTFPKPGEYRFKLFADGEFLLERRILIYQHPQQEGESNA